jgi:glycosyltransferase involved in cell wall biosynthesis
MEARKKFAKLHKRSYCKPMRILVFSTDDHLHPAGGAEQAFGNIAKKLSHIEFDLVCARLRKNTPRFERDGNIAIHRIGFGIPKLDGLLLALFGHRLGLKLFKRQGHNLIWSIMASYGAFSAVRVKRKTKLPHLLTLQEGDSFEYIYKQVSFVRKQFNQIFETADGLQAISQYLKEWGEHMGFRGKHSVVIPNGVNLERFAKPIPDGEVAVARKNFGFGDDVLILFTSSRLEKKNGIGDVLTALKSLPPHVCFVICGGGSLETDLKKQIQKFGLEKRVVMKGFVDNSELPLLMSASDIFIRPSLSEGLGISFLEAMATGILVVATPVGGIVDFLIDGETGLFVGVQNPESITEVVNHIASMEPDRRNAITLRAKSMVQKEYNWDSITKEMETLFNQLAS